MGPKYIYTPTKCVHDWKYLLASPKKHWVPGHSAMLLASSWENAEGLPCEIASLLAHSVQDRLHHAKLLLAIPEYKVPFRGGSRGSQNDIFALLENRKRDIISMTVEGKAIELFGPTLREWKSKTSQRGIILRLQDIDDNLPSHSVFNGRVRYQLLHRAASAVKMGRKFQSSYALMIVQSFADIASDDHFGDYQRFLSFFPGVSQTIEKNILIEVGEVHEIKLYSGWVTSKAISEIHVK